MCKYFGVYGDVFFCSESLREKHMDVWVNVSDDAVKNRGASSMSAMNCKSEVLYSYAGMYNVIAAEAVVVVRTLLNSSNWNQCVERRLVEHLSAENASLVRSLCKTRGDGGIGSQGDVQEVDVALVDSLIYFTAAASVLGGHLDVLYESGFVHIVDPQYRCSSPNSTNTNPVNSSSNIAQLMRSVQHLTDSVYVSSVHFDDDRKCHYSSRSSDRRIQYVPRNKVKPLSRFPVSLISRGMVSPHVLSTLFVAVNIFGVDFWDNYSTDNTAESSEQEESKIESDVIEEKSCEEEDTTRPGLPERFHRYSRGVLNVLLKCLCELITTNQYVSDYMNSLLCCRPADGASN